MIRTNTWPSRRDPEWTRRLGASPPMRMHASWFWSGWINRIQVCDAISRPRRTRLGEVVSMSPTTKSSPHPQACRGARDRQGLRRFAMACGHPLPSLRPRGQLPPCRDEEMSFAVEQGDDPHGLITTTLDAPHTSIPKPIDSSWRRGILDAPPARGMTAIHSRRAHARSPCA